MANPKEEIATVEKIENIFEKELNIPDYQRPYKWQTTHIEQLLDDLITHFQENKVYRIGAVVFHDNGKLDIVDGQQRLTTLALILFFLNKEKMDITIHLNEKTISIKNFLEQEVKHSISHFNIANNYKFIENRLENTKKKEQFSDYILTQCEMVCITLNDIDEAFQFFDSQNSSGKKLETFDLLKAYHLRAFSENTHTPKVLKYVEQWEVAAEKEPKDDLPNLNTIIDNQLFRLRQWRRNKDAEIFTGKDINVFKGINFDENYPNANIYKFARFFYQNNQNLLHSLSQKITMPFNIQQPLFNGEYFFEFIQYYRKLYSSLFNPQKIKYEVIFERKNTHILNFLQSYKGAYRIGDQYCKMLFETTLLAYYDKFGDELLDIATEKVFKWAYQTRLENSRVSFPTIQNHAWNSNGLLFWIDNMNHSKDILHFHTIFNHTYIEKNATEITDLKSVFNIQEKNEKGKNNE
ncbi:DUF262 domain-containing protein [Pasteurella atlantica]|uniref:DUF262 domain-containing protein n=1 Tax=Pasteurellaceae TaxID=712 RepID=UPI0027636F5A|nr:DUF262 domain-containing protein [Pasteurella atlantica]MDP8034194.1 DUF262 domain-containing protein [Pasteurella atlantica]MDP8036143.1 DUF262 domain-containing protein [Pasteurella atlantica]MDP8038093.1 DUF262 domain-containing protein [Pasteurella atlantica]MDP8048448.1 DUF262 domain-containing protein [Pasteurella atlantica]MDP8050405.1 DUF262 domain-containing protein [Pasteurella atlantica]